MQTDLKSVIRRSSATMLSDAAGLLALVTMLVLALNLTSAI